MRSYPLNTMKKRQFVWVVLFVIAMGSVLLIALYSRNVQFQIGETVFVRSGDWSGLSDYEPVMCVSYETKDSNLVVFTMSIGVSFMIVAVGYWVFKFNRWKNAKR